jgi:uncharacterized protein (TIGR00251 family)
VLDVRDVDGGATLRVRVSPRASRNAVAGERDGALVVRVTAAPVEGAANEALARVLARVLHVPASAVAVRRGASGRDKLLHVSGLDAATLVARLGSGGESR